MRRQGDHPLDFPPQLPHVARPAIAFEQIQHVRRKTGHVFFETAADIFQKRERHRRNVFFAIPERRQRDFNGKQTEKQVFSKPPRFDFGLQGFIRRADQPQVIFNQAFSAETIPFPFLNRSQEFGLNSERHVGNFVKKERAAAGFFEIPAPRRVRAGKCAFFVAEKLAFHQVLRNRRAVDRNKWLIFAFRFFMNHASNEFFARAIFAMNQHVHRRFADQPRLFDNRFHGRTFRDKWDIAEIFQAIPLDFAVQLAGNANDFAIQDNAFHQNGKMPRNARHLREVISLKVPLAMIQHLDSASHPMPGQAVNRDADEILRHEPGLFGDFGMIPG